MGNNLFGLNISGKINASLGRRLPRATLTSFTPGTRTAVNPSAGTNPTSTVHTCRAVRIGMSSLKSDTILPETSDVILIIGDSISPVVAPKENDTITIKDVVNTVTKVDSDPDLASYTCQVK